MEIRQDYLAVSRPHISEADIKSVAETLRGGWWGRGPKVAEFEAKFAELVGSKYALAVSSNSHGLDLVIRALGFKQETLLSPTMSFATTAVVPMWSGNSTRLVDIRDSDLCIDPALLSSSQGQSAKAVIAVNFAGNLADISEIRAAFDGVVIEDCAHSLFTPGAGKHSDVAVWSLHALKTLPVGDGGVITLDDKQLYDQLLTLSWFGIASTHSRMNSMDLNGQESEGYSWDYSISVVGQKAQMNDITASLALSQLDRLDDALAARRHVRDRYDSELPEEIRRPLTSETVQYYIARVAPSIRNSLIDFLATKNIHTSVHYKPLHLHPLFSGAGTFEVAERAWHQILSLPCHSGMKDEDIDYVVGWTREFFSKRLDF